MENNKILIGVQFTGKDQNFMTISYNIELYVLRDLPMSQLLDGIQYGLKKLIQEEDKNKDIYRFCEAICSNCLRKIGIEGNKREYYSSITFTSFNALQTSDYIRAGERALFYLDQMDQPICNLGFITSSRIIFDETGVLKPEGKLDTNHIVEAFNPEYSKRIFFPEYNISSRQLYQFDEKEIEVIEPSEPPQETKNTLFFMLLPSLLTISIMVLVRGLLIGKNSGSGASMLFLTVGMGLVTLITSTIAWKRQKDQYAQNLKDWREQYQNYADSLIQTIEKRQRRDILKMEELYPDMLNLIEKDERGIYSMNENLYSRAPQDKDFLAFRIGYSDDVESKFVVKGNDREVIFSDANYDLYQDEKGHDRVKISLRRELKEKTVDPDKNLCRFPTYIAERYKYMKSAPLIYSVKDKGALGIVDYHIDSDYAFSKYFISRMIFELCYYHSPEDLQFVMFFNKKEDWAEIENVITMYKFMPHFRGLFSDKSQFVFDADSANLVMSSLLTEMTARKNAGGQKTPHIIVIVFDEHGMKEHAFAEFLPKVPEDSTQVQDYAGLTFVFATKHKEYLPVYCDDIVSFDNNKMSITPRNDENRRKTFRFGTITGNDMRAHYRLFTDKATFALRFFSSVYYAKIAQNGKVPSTVSTFELLKNGNEDLKSTVSRNWGYFGKRTSSDITESLAVPVGKTETDIAYLDLHEKGDGPHMLVAGTTGSGKSETIITYLLGLCSHFRPDELNLLLVDMKGGGFTKRIGLLPHVVGTVTYVDGDENGTGAEYMLFRFLNAMKAEIKRRKILFNKLHVDNIDAYIKACRDIETFILQKKLSGNEADRVRKTAKEEPLSHLILVVDEFTELKRFTSENSELDFMGEITTIARVGRSLGFHIILISQNIEGAITDDIRVNSRARLCLKVATRQASKDMIGTELAASPQMPGNGRAYLLVGTGSKFEYFQSGYSGAGITESIPVTITYAKKVGAYLNFYNSEKDNTELLKKRAEMKKLGTAKTQLEAICDAICTVYEDKKNEKPKPHIVFRPPLPSRIAMDHNGNLHVLNSEKGEID